MNGDITKYIREVYGIAQQLNCLMGAASSDAALPVMTREDLQWELARLKSATADCVAALIEVNTRERT